MKKRIVLLVLAIPIFMFAQRKPKIKGNRSVTEVKEELPAFNAIELNDDLDIQLKKSYGEGYEIIADDNLIDVLKFKVEDSTLVISSFYKITAKKKLKITVNFKELKAINQKAGKITVEDIISSDNLYINTFGSSKIELKASGGIASLNMEDTSKGDFNVDVDSLNISLKNKADAKIYAVSGAKNIELYNTASLKLEGTTDTLKLKMENNTKFDGEKMEASTAILDVTSSASTRVNAYKEFELTSSGSSKTYLYGNPRISILQFLDTSQLIKKK